MQRTQAWTSTIAITAAIAMVAMAGCGGSGDGGASDDRSPSSLLSWVPSSVGASPGPVIFADLDGVRDGKSASSFEDDITLLDERSRRGPIMPLAFSGSILDPEFAEFAGFDTRNISAWAEAGSLPDVITVLVGRFDAGKIEKALRSSPGGEALDVQRDGDTVVMALGEEGQSDFAAASPIRRTGGALVVGLVGDVLVWGSTEARVRAALAAHTDGTSLADAAATAALAAALTDASVMSGGVATPTGGESWEMVGFGESYSADLTTVTIVFRYASPAAAADAVGAFTAHVADDTSVVNEQPWAERLTLQSAVTDGNLMVATLTSEGTAVVLRNLSQLDNLLVF